MSKDDYYVIACRILAYLYACLKAGEKPSLQYLTYGTDDFPVGKDYWEYILAHLCEAGYIEGVEQVPILGKSKAVRLTAQLCITPAGIDYLQNNTAIQKAMRFLRQLKESIPGL